MSISGFVGNSCPNFTKFPVLNSRKKAHQIFAKTLQINSFFQIFWGWTPDSSQRVGTSVVPDPDFWSPIRQNYEIFLDPEPDWISFLLKPDPDPDYPKRFEQFLIFLRFFFPAKILLITWEFWCWMMWFILFFNLSRMVDFHTAVVRWCESDRLQSPLAMAIALSGM